MALLEITTEEIADFLILKIKGKLDAQSSPILIEKLNALVIAGKVKLVLDISQVPFMSSAGIGATIKTLDDTKSKKGVLKIVGAKPEVLKVYEILGFAPAFSFYETVQDALKF